MFENPKRKVNNMKKIVFIAGFAAVLGLFGQAPESGLLLHSSFDKLTTEPDYAANPKTAVTGIPQKLQDQKGKDAGNPSNFVTLSNKEFVGYTHQDNFNPQCGTISFRVKPVNWNMNDKGVFQNFFEVRSGDCAYRLIINKTPSSSLVSASITWNKKNYSVGVYIPWKTGEWHKIDFTWDSKGIKLYLDGKSARPHSRGEFTFPADPEFPASIKWASMRLNYFQGWQVNPEWVTAYDDLKIYNRVLSQEEIEKSCGQK